MWNSSPLVRPSGYSAYAAVPVDRDWARVAADLAALPDEARPLPAPKAAAWRRLIAVAASGMGRLAGRARGVRVVDLALGARGAATMRR